jgi:branched-chain amino acid transport system substrate-binding protein
MNRQIDRKCLIALIFMVGAIGVAIPAFAQEVVKIGAIYSAAGPAAGVAKIQKQATELAIKDVNEAGGINLGGKKMKLEVLFGDDQSKVDTATALYQDMVKKQGITAVIGGSLAHIPLAINTAVKQDPALFISTCAVPDTFHQQAVKAPTSLGMLGGAADIGRTAASYIAEKMKPKKVAVFVPAYAFGQALASGFESVIKKYPDVKYNIFWHPLGSTDIKRDLVAVRDFRPDVIAIGSFGQDAANAITQASLMGLGKDARLFHLWFLDSFAAAIPPDAMKGVWAQMFWYHDMTGFKDEAIVKDSNEFVSKYMNAYGEPPDPFAVPAYFAVKEVARAMELAQSTDPVKMYAALMAHPVWTSAKGEAKWRQDGRCIYHYFDFIVEGKGPDERKSGPVDSKYDFGRIVDAFTGEASAPPLKELGY